MLGRSPDSSVTVIPTCPKAPHPTEHYTHQNSWGVIVSIPFCWCGGGSPPPLPPSPSGRALRGRCSTTGAQCRAVRWRRGRRGWSRTTGRGPRRTTGGQCSDVTAVVLLPYAPGLWAGLGPPRPTWQQRGGGGGAGGGGGQHFSGSRSGLAGLCCRRKARLYFRTEIFFFFVPLRMPPRVLVAGFG